MVQYVPEICVFDFLLLAFFGSPLVPKWMIFKIIEWGFQRMLNASSLFQLNLIFSLSLSRTISTVLPQSAPHFDLEWLQHNFIFLS